MYSKLCTFFFFFSDSEKHRLAHKKSQGWLQWGKETDQSMFGFVQIHRTDWNLRELFPRKCLCVAYRTEYENNPAQDSVKGNLNLFTVKKPRTELTGKNGSWLKYLNCSGIAVAFWHSGRTGAALLYPLVCLRLIYSWGCTSETVEILCRWTDFESKSKVE